LAERSYIIPYSKNTRKRHYHKTERGRVVNFVVRLRWKLKANGKPCLVIIVLLNLPTETPIILGVGREKKSLV
jgi:hypothetical protein